MACFDGRFLPEAMSENFLFQKLDFPLPRLSNTPTLTSSIYSQIRENLSLSTPRFVQSIHGGNSWPFQIIQNPSSFNRPFSGVTAVWPIKVEHPSSDWKRLQPTDNWPCNMDETEPEGVLMAKADRRILGAECNAEFNGDYPTDDSKMTFVHIRAK